MKIPNYRQPTTRPGRQTFVRSGGAGKVADLLNALASDDKQLSHTLMEKLEQRNPLLGREVRKKLIRFDDLVRLSQCDLQRVIRELEKTDLLYSLKLANSKVKEAIYSSLSKRAAEELQQELLNLGPVPIRKVEEAQTHILESVTRLEKCGEIVLDETWL